MSLKKKLPLLMALLGIISAVGAILLFAIALPAANAPYKKILTAIIASLLLVLSLLAAYYLYVMRDVEPNFFLFDRSKKRHIPVEELTFKTVNERMNFFLTLVCESAVQL